MTSPAPLKIVILAAGLGKRMYSKTPKVLHKLAGKTLLEHVVQTAEALTSSTPIVIYGHQGDTVRQALPHLNVQWMEQKEQLGTGHALMQALPGLQPNERVLVLYGDAPLVSLDTLQTFVASVDEKNVGIITAHLANPFGLGRIIRDAKNNVINIVEEKDTTEAERQLNEVNSGFYVFPANKLNTWLPKLNNHNAQSEFYLTDVVKIALDDNTGVQTFQVKDTPEIQGINNRQQLAELERYFQRKQAEKLLLQGVTLLDPNRFDVRGELIVGEDVVIDVNVIFEGRVIIGNRCKIGANCILRNVILGDDVDIKSHSVIEESEIGNHSVVGPFARLRPGASLSAHTHVGNFVEIKNSCIGEGSKINHLSYIGDTNMGKHVNIGAGTITCNYDGANKHRTVIGDAAFIGSNTSLVAPVVIGKEATIGAGSTISREAPPEQLTLCRAEQRSIKNWQRPKKKEA